MSTLEVNNFSDGTDTVGSEYLVHGSAKSWVNFNGTGTIATRDSLNVSSLTDNGTGNYMANFSSNFGNGNFAGASAGAGAKMIPIDQQAPGSVRITNYNDAGTIEDNSLVYSILAGDLA